MDYGLPVLRNEIATGKYTYLAVLRHYRDLKEAGARGLVFRPDFGWHAIQYIEKFFVHIKGPLAGKPILLDPWQKFWTAVLYGWRRAGSLLRRFTRAYEEVARKNGKSTWKGPQGAYLFSMAGQGGAEVYAVATTRAQAMTVFKPAFDNIKRWCRRSPGAKRSFKVFEGLNQEKVQCGDSNVFAPLPANAEHLDGLNPYAILYDELHAAATREVWDVMESALGAREDPLLSAITTAGFILNGICVEIRTYLVSVLEGRRLDDSMFGYIYTLDAGDDYYDERNWPKANPGLGRSKMWDYMRTQARKAKALPGARANFLTKDLNIWCNNAEGWFDIQVWDKGGKPFNREMLKGRRCFGGLDLASVRDLTAFVLVFPPLEGETTVHILAWFWAPESKQDEEADDEANYRQWAEEGWLTLTPGNVTDYGAVHDVVVQAGKDYEIEQLGFDDWNAQQLVNDLLAADLPMVNIPQNTGGMGPGSKELERLVYGGLLAHGGNPVLRYCAGNVSLLFDTNGNYRPNKKASKENGRIDGIVAAVMALGRMAAPDDSGDEDGFFSSPTTK